MEHALAKSRNDALFASAKNRYLTGRMERLLHQTVDILTGQVRKGRFLPADYEVGFGMAEELNVQEFALGEEERMRKDHRLQIGTDKVFPALTVSRPAAAARCLSECGDGADAAAQTGG